MAERVAPGDYDRLHHLVSDGIWDEAPLERELALQADRRVGGADAFLVIIDDTALPKMEARQALASDVARSRRHRLQRLAGVQDQPLSHIG
jgi:hypothetical protein